MKKEPRLFFAGQMTGVEGYIESASSGFIAGINAALRARDLEGIDFPAITAAGALAHYVSSFNQAFQPMNVNFGIMPPLDKKVKGGKARRNEEISRRSLEYVDSVLLPILEKYRKEQ